MLIVLFFLGLVLGASAATAAFTTLRSLPRDNDDWVFF